MSDNNQPDLIAYTTTKNASGKTFYNRVGAAWKHSKGNGFSVEMSAQPIDGKFVFFPPKEQQTS